MKRRGKFLGVKLFSMLVVTLLLCMPSLAQADSISPAVFGAYMGVGESATITKTVIVDDAPATKVDVFFMSDSTGSMYGEIANIRAAASSILSSTASLGDVAFAVGQYRDIYDSFTYRLEQDITTSQALAQAGINTWNAGGGGDWPEANIHALEQAATTTSWRAGSERIMVWFGDAPGHDPRAGSTEASATAALVANEVQVQAISVRGTGLDYYGQASRIAAATGGTYYPSVNTSAIVTTINDAISTAVNTYTNVGLDLSEVPVGVTVTASPGSHSGSWDRSTTETFHFDVTFTGDTPGTYDFSIYGTVDGGRIATETDHIVVSGAASVPEPATLLLLGSGLAGLAFYRRKWA